MANENCGMATLCPGFTVAQQGKLGVGTITITINTAQCGPLTGAAALAHVAQIVASFAAPEPGSNAKLLN